MSFVMLTIRTLHVSRGKLIDLNDTVVVVDVEDQDWASVGLTAKLNRWVRTNP